MKMTKTLIWYTLLIGGIGAGVCVYWECWFIRWFVKYDFPRGGVKNLEFLWLQPFAVASFIYTIAAGLLLRKRHVGIRVLQSGVIIATLAILGFWAQLIAVDSASFGATYLGITIWFLVGLVLPSTRLVFGHDMREHLTQIVGER